MRQEKACSAGRLGTDRRPSERLQVQGEDAAPTLAHGAATWAAGMLLYSSKSFRTDGDGSGKSASLMWEEMFLPEPLPRGPVVCFSVPMILMHKGVTIEVGLDSKF